MTNPVPNPQPPGAVCPACRLAYPPDIGACPTCVACTRCGDMTSRVETISTLHASAICPRCAAHYWRCEVCDGWNELGEDCANGCCDPNGCDCEDCRSDDDEADAYGLIRSYSYKPAPVFHGSGPLFLGPELEIQTPYGRNRACAELARTHLGRLGYLKSDSSIDHGFEIVTHPMSYPWALNHFPWPMLTQLRHAGCDAPPGTGLHVHVSRAGFSSACHTYRWMKFIYRNAAQVTTLARRRSDEWAAFTDDDRRAVKHYAKGGRGHRYRAINTNNPDTFELRVFASTLRADQLKAALGFAAASVEYTRALTAHTITRHGGWTWTAFVTWLAAHPTYRPLTHQLERLACVC